MVLCADTLREISSNKFKTGMHCVETSDTIENIEEERYSEVFAIRAYHSSILSPIGDEKIEKIEKNENQTNFFSIFQNKNKNKTKNKKNEKEKKVDAPLTVGKYLEKSRANKTAYNYLYNKEGQIVFQPKND